MGEKTHMAQRRSESSTVHGTQKSTARKSTGKTESSSASLGGASQWGNLQLQGQLHSPGKYLHKAISSPGSGDSLSMGVRKKVEPVLGTDLSQVKVHADKSSQSAAAAINAKAFTHKGHIYLGANQSAYDTKLMSHELTHVQQQNRRASGTAELIQRSPLPSTEFDWESLFSPVETENTGADQCKANLCHSPNNPTPQYNWPSPLTEDVSPLINWQQHFSETNNNSENINPGLGPVTENTFPDNVNTNICRGHTCHSLYSQPSFTPRVDFNSLQWDPTLLSPATRSRDQFREGNNQCYDRATQPYTMVADSHVHHEPFGGHSVPTSELYSYFDRANVLFNSAYGIGQVLPRGSGCEYYKDCPGTPVRPSLRNDIINAENLHDFRPEEFPTILSRTFPDLANPDNVPEVIHLLDRAYPGMFTGMGEVNLVKQALFPNGHEATPVDAIAEWAPFMAILRERNSPISIHSDLGNDSNPTQYMYLMQTVLGSYPNNKVVWMHMGMSLEQTNLNPQVHTALMSSFLDSYPNLMLDISWRVLWDHYFSDPVQREVYVAFLNRYSDRIITGTDFVASSHQAFEDYETLVEVNSRILQYLDDEAFQRIALGENYFRLYNMPFRAPEVCPPPFDLGAWLQAQ